MPLGLLDRHTQLLNTQRTTTRNTSAQHEIHRSMIMTPIYSEQPDMIGYYNQYYHPLTQSFDASAILQELLEVWLPDINPNSTVCNNTRLRNHNSVHSCWCYAYDFTNGAWRINIITIKQCYELIKSNLVPHKKHWLYPIRYLALYEATKGLIRHFIFSALIAQILFYYISF
jgi:hypothetical protein